jgi:hypothetical protein
MQAFITQAIVAYVAVIVTVGTVYAIAAYVTSTRTREHLENDLPEALRVEFDRQLREVNRAAREQAGRHRSGYKDGGDRNLALDRPDSGRRTGPQIYRPQVGEEANIPQREEGPEHPLTYAAEWRAGRHGTLSSFTSEILAS